MSLFDLAWWAKAQLGDHVPSLGDMICNSGNIEVPRRTRKIREHWVWKPLVYWKIKVNVNGCFLGGLGKVGIRGVFRDSEGRVLLQFCKEVIVDLAVEAEVLALREGLLVAVTSCWASTHSFMFKSDLSSIITWAVNPLSAPWRHHFLIRDCCNVFSHGIRWSISHISRSGNDAVDTSVRMGSKGINLIEFA